MTRMFLRPLSLTVAATILLAGSVMAADANSAQRRAVIAGTTAPPLNAALVAMRQHQYAQAVQLLSRSAMAGNVDAQYLLGMVYLNGLGQLPDVKQAAAWMEKAAVHGHPQAAFVLAAVLSRGELADQTRARAWLQRSAELGYERARAALADPRPLLAAERNLPTDAALLVDYLRLAAARDDVAMLNQMDKSFLTVRDEFGCTALCMAVRHRALAVASWLLQQGADPQTADSFGTTPLMRAATQTTPAMLVLLLSSPRINVNAVDQEQRSALFYAARSNQANAVRTLLGAGASLDVTDSRGYGAMDVAVLANANEAVGVLRELGARQQADVVERSDSIARIDLGRPGVLYRDWPAAALAAARNDVAQLRAQLASPGVLEQRTPQGDTLLHVAYHARAMDALRLLVDAGANASAPDRRGRSMLSLAAGDNSVSTLQLLTAGGHVSRSALPAALDAAVSANAVDTTRLLLGAGASADVVDASGNSMVSVASRLDYVDVVRLLLTSGGNVNAVNRAGRGPLWQAARAGHVNVVVTLLAAHASLEAADYDGNTPLQAAVFSGKPEVVAALLNAGAQTGQLNRNGDTALILAAATGQLDLVNALLARPHRVNTQNRFGDTALIVASRNGHAAVCRTLLKDGASLTLRNGNRLNAVDMARDRGFAQLADELSKAG